jgi:hypothetical protein
MERSPPNPLSDEQVNAMLDGVAPREIVDQFALDPDAAARLETWQRWNERMQQQLGRWDCPSSQQIAAYHWGDVDRATARTIARHLESCVRCSEEIETLRVFLATDTTSSVPQRAPTHAHSPLPRLRELIGTVVPRVPALAVRGGHGAPIMAEAGDVTLVLDVQSTNDGNVAVLGQVAAPEPDRWTGALVEVRQNSVVRAVAEADDIGSFRCASVPPGPSELRVTAPDGTSVVLSVDLGNKE